jgi:hypothetical protein
MAISALMIWEVQLSGQANNGGGFRGTALFPIPAAPIITGSATGGTVAAGTYYCRITYLGIQGGESPVSAERSVTVSGTTSSFTVNSPTDHGLGDGAFWNLYTSTTSGGPYFPAAQGTIGTSKVVAVTPPTTASLGPQPPGIDYSQQIAPQVTIDNAAIIAITPTANSNTLQFTAGYTATYADVGNVVNITGGSNVNAGRYEITAYTSTTWTLAGAGNLTTASGAGSAITGQMGGCVDHPATAVSAFVAGNLVMVKYSGAPFGFTTNAPNVSGGYINCGVAVQWQGYDGTRRLDNTNANRPIFNAGVASTTMVTLTGSAQSFKGFSFTNTGAFASVTAFSIGTGHVVQRCIIDGIASACTTNNSASRFVDCAVTNWSGSAFSGGAGNGHVWIRCYAGPPSSGSSPAFTIGGSNYLEDCIADRSVGHGFSAASTGISLVRRCTARGCTLNGFNLTILTVLEHCLSYGNTGIGFSGGSAGGQSVLRNCAAGGNTGGNYSPSFYTTKLINCQNLTADPFTNAAGGDFSLNNVAGAGALCRSLAVALPAPSTTSYPDAGAAQHQDSGAAVLYAY